MPGHYGSHHSGGKKEKTGGGSNRPNPHTDSGRSRATSVSKGALARNKTAMEKVKAAQGKAALDNYKVKKVPGVGPVSWILNAGQDLRQKGVEYNRKFFREKVLTSKNRGNYVDTLDSYSDYIRGRGAGTIDAYGNPISQGGGGDGNQTLLSQEPAAGVVTSDGIVGPIIGSNAVKTQEEIQAEKNKEGGIILAKRIGRSRMIKTSAQGLTDDEDIITRKQLLG